MGEDHGGDALFSYRSPNAIALEHTLMAFLSSVLVGASRFAHAG